MFSNFLNSAFYEIMCKYIVQTERPQMAIWYMHIACWIGRTKNATSECTILLLFHWNNDCTIALQLYSILPVLLFFSFVTLYYLLFIYLFIHYLQLGRHPVVGVVTCYIITDYEDFTLKFSYGGLHEKHVVATGDCRESSQHLLKDPGKPRKPWDYMAGHRTFRVPTFSQSSGI